MQYLLQTGRISDFAQPTVHSGFKYIYKNIFCIKVPFEDLGATKMIFIFSEILPIPSILHLLIKQNICNFVAN